MRRELARTIRRFKRAVLCVCLVAWLAALVATHVPPPKLPTYHVSDKTLHAVGYFVLAGLFWLSLAGYGVRTRRRVLLVVCVMIVYAAVDEKTQGWVNRNPDVLDWLADAVGTVLAVGALETLRAVGRKARRESANQPPGDDRYPQYPY